MPHIPSVAAFLDPANGYEPTEAERRLIAACQKGEHCILSDERPTGPTDANVVRADLIRLLILGGTKDCGLHESGVWLEGGWVTGMLDLSHSIGRGKLVLDEAIFEKALVLSYAQFDQVSFVRSKLPGLHAECLQVKHNLSFAGAMIRGCINLMNAVVGGQISLTGANLDAGGTHAVLKAQGLRAGSLIFRDIRESNGAIELVSAHVSDLVDEPKSWNQFAGKIHLIGFSYDRLVDVWKTKERLNWLASLKGVHFSPQPYTQLAKTLAAMGHNRAARRVLYEREEILGQEQLREGRKKLSELWRGSRGDSAAAQEVRADIGEHWCRMRFWQATHWLFGRVVGHGYLPERALIVSLKVLTVATLGYFIVWRAGGMVPNSDVVMTSAQWAQAMAENPAAPAHAWEHLGAGQHYETFNAFAYAADVFVPLFDLGQESAWAATTANFLGTMAWGAKWLLQGMGWLVSALGVAAITGIMQKDRD
jgi:hypothetical protein